MYANPHTGINLLPALSRGLRQTRFRATRRVSASSLAAVHATRCAADQAMATAALPAYTEIDYATFRAWVDHRDASAPARQFITRGNSVLIAGRHRQVLAKLEMPWIDHWGVAHGARYFAPTRPCTISLQAWLALAIPPLLGKALKLPGGTLKLIGSPLKLFASSLINMHRRCKTVVSRSRAGWRVLHASQQASAVHREPHWTTIRLTA